MALPTYERTILRQVQEADMSEANVWKTLAATMDNFSAQIGSTTRAYNAREAQKAATAKADLRYQTALDLTATKYAKSQEDKKIAQAATADKLAVSTFVNAKESDVTTSLSQLSIDYANDYDGYLAAANELMNTWMDNDELDTTTGMRAAFERLVTNKIAQYGEAPYQAVATKNIEEGRAVAEQNVEDFVTDAVHQMAIFIDSVADGSIELLDDPDNYARQTDLVAGKYMTLEAKLTELIANNNYSAEEVIALQDEMELKFFSGVIKAQISNEMKIDKGWTAIDEFEEDPAKFISSRPHLQALIPKGVTISDDMADSIYDDIFSHYKDTLTQTDYLQTKLEEEVALKHADNYSLMFASVVNPEVNIEQYTIRDMLASDDLSNEGHDNLLKAIAQDTYVKDDELTLFDLKRLIVTSDRSEAELETMITNAFLDGDISGATASTLLTQNVEAKQAKNKEYFQIGWNAIATGLVGNPDMMDSGSGQVLNFAQQEFYNRVQGYTDADGTYHPPELAMDIYNEIIEKYKPMMVDSADDTEVIEQLPMVGLDPEVGASFQTMEFDESTGWNTFFIGTRSAPAAVQTKIKVAQLIIDNAITKEQGELILGQLDKYMKKHLGLE